MMNKVMEEYNELKKVHTVYDYMNSYGNVSLSDMPFSEVDNLVLSRISYFPLDNIVDASFEKRISIKEAAEKMLSDEKITSDPDFVLQEDIELMRLLTHSTRFNSLELFGYINKIDLKEQKQFACLTISLPNDIYFVSYRGTDNTIVGWKEDFNMTFMSVVPAQAEAVDYLNEVAKKLKGNFYIGGHSKGGNLAVYASIFTDNQTKDRILAIYNNDGPGFVDSVLELVEYQEVKNRIHTFVPQSSVVGMLLAHEDNYTVVKSNQHGIMQHDVYSWEVENNNFVHLERVNANCTFMNYTLKAWVDNTTANEREQFFNTVYDILEATNAKTIPEINADWLKNAQAMIKAYNGLDTDMKKSIDDALLSLFQLGSKNLHYLSKKEK